MQKAIETSNGLKGGLLKGKAHYDSNGNPLGGIKAVVTDQGGKPIEVEGNEVIINKKTVASEKVLTIKGTPKEILSTLNQMDGNGVAIGDEEAEILAKYRTGGRIPSDINKLSLNEFEEYLEEKYNSKIELGDYKKYIYLGRIEVDKETRGLGIGSEIMSEIIDYADYNDKKITLTPSTDYGASSVARLKDFYKKFGFVENKGRNKDFEISQLMYRVPKANKYHLGGDMSKHLAPNGKPSNLNHEQWHLVRTPEFLEFFGNWINLPETASKVVDENGEPLVCYHGTKNKNINTFNNVNYNEIYEYNAYGIYSSESIENAKHYSGDTGNVISIFVDIKNPYNLGTRETDKGRPTDKNLRAIAKERYEFYIEKGYDGVIFTDLRGIMFEIVAFEPNQIKLADGTNTTFDSENPDIRFAEGGSISRMTPSELKAFYNSKEGKKLDAQTYSEWKRLVNMTKSELEKFYNSVEGKEAGLSPEEAKEQGIDSGRESARWIMKMKDIPYKEWSSDMWRWAKKQINFIKRMSGMKGSLYNDKGEKTRKHTALLIWGHNPEQKFAGGGYVPKDAFTKSENERNEDYEANWNLWIDTLLKNENLPIHWTTSESRKELYGDSFYITIFNEDWQEFAKLRFSGHSVMNTSRLQNEFHNPKISRFYEIVSRAMNKGQQDKHPEKLVRFKGGGELSKKALAVETNDLTDFVRKYFIKDGRIDVADAMQELFGNRRGKSIADEYRKRIGLHKKGGLTISQLAHNLWEQHRDEVREGIDDSDFRNAVEEVLISEYGVSSMIKSLIEKSGESEQDKENEFWMNQFDEGDDEYYEDLSDEEVADYFKDMEGFESELAKGTEHEMEHLETLKKVAEGKLTPEQGVVETAKTHIKENPEYYEDLAKMERENEGIKIGTEFYDYYEPIKQRVVSFDGERIFSVPVNIPKSEQDDYRLKRIFKIDRLKEILSRQDEFEKEINSSLESQQEYDLKKELETKKQLIKKDEKDMLSKAFSGSKLQVGKKLVTLRKLIKYNGLLYTLKEYIDKIFSELNDDEKIEIKNIKNEPHLSVNNSTYKSLINETGLEYFKYLLSLKEEQEESIPELIEGLKVLADSLEGAEKKEIEDVIEGLEILLESEDRFAEGGGIEAVLWATKIGEPDYNEQLITEDSSQIEDAKKWALANGFDRIRVSRIDNSKPDFTKGFNKYAEGGSVDNNTMIFEPSKADQDEEKRIMENQFGKNI
jgi:GNAT superfamily N-acetyltransferase